MEVFYFISSDKNISAYKYIFLKILFIPQRGFLAVHVLKCHKMDLYY